jgi:hypothetical protein
MLYGPQRMDCLAQNAGCSYERANGPSASILRASWLAEQPLLPQAGFCAMEWFLMIFKERGSEGMRYMWPWAELPFVFCKSPF